MIDQLPPMNRMRVPTKYGPIEVSIAPFSDEKFEYQVDRQVRSHEDHVNQFRVELSQIRNVARTLHVLIESGRPWFDVSDYLDCLTEMHRPAAQREFQMNGPYAWSCPAGCSD